MPGGFSDINIGGKFAAAQQAQQFRFQQPPRSFQFATVRDGEETAEEKRANTMKSLSRMAIRRMARRGGVKRISAKIYKEARILYYILSHLKIFPVGTVNTRKAIVQDNDLYQIMPFSFYMHDVYPYKKCCCDVLLNQSV